MQTAMAVLRAWLGCNTSPGGVYTRTLVTLVQKSALKALCARYPAVGRLHVARLLVVTAWMIRLYITFVPISLGLSSAC